VIEELEAELSRRFLPRRFVHGCWALDMGRLRMRPARRDLEQFLEQSRDRCGLRGDYSRAREPVGRREWRFALLA